MKTNEASGELSGPARERFERVAARIAGEVWGGRWRPVPADELVDLDEDELAEST